MVRFPTFTRRQTSTRSVPFTGLPAVDRRRSGVGLGVVRIERFRTEPMSPAICDLAKRQLMRSGSSGRWTQRTARCRGKQVKGSGVPSHDCVPEATSNFERDKLNPCGPLFTA